MMAVIIINFKNYVFVAREKKISFVSYHRVKLVCDTMLQVLMIIIIIFANTQSEARSVKSPPVSIETILVFEVHHNSFCNKIMMNFCPFKNIYSKEC